jgi:prepilin-type N-terminal cleavage/methylation domain-containing protein
MKRQNSGFTLVEIAIVLVIVGLLIGGVLKGQEMITNAKLKRIESDNAGIAAAMFSYQDRYLQLPGDDSAASTRFDAYAPAGVENTDANGNGLGTIGDGTDWDTITGTTGQIVNGSVETELFFAHLRAAGLIPGGATDTTRPTNAYGGLIGIQDGSLLIAGHVTIFGQIEGPIAKIIEARLDDGEPESGRIQADLTDQTMDGGAAPAASSVTDYSDASRYNMAFRL